MLKGLTMSGFDMHIHSTASDGALAPALLVETAHAQGLLGMALTDHDTASGVAEAAARAAELDFNLIPGIELSAELGDHDVHILGYWIDPQQIESDEELIAMRQGRYRRCYEMVDRLKRLGMELDADELIASVPGCGSPGRPLLARAMVEKGYVKTVKEAFTKWLSRGMPGYVPRPKLEPSDALRIVIRCGGVPVLAHPGVGVPDSLIPVLVKNGLGGIEVYHPEHNALAERKYAQIVRQYGLAFTGGSDFHLEGVRMIGGRITPLSQLALLAEMRERLQASRGE